jgi:hypothetical protein
VMSLVHPRSVLGCAVISRAASATIISNRFTPIEKFAAATTPSPMRSASRRYPAAWSAQPVVPMTTAAAGRHSGEIAFSASAVEKSTATSAGAASPPRPRRCDRRPRRPARRQLLDQPSHLAVADDSSLTAGPRFCSGRPRRVPPGGIDPEVLDRSLEEFLVQAMHGV